MKIKKITAREILDSRGNPTIQAMVELSNGVRAKASVPSGASTGIHEATELRDGDQARYRGKGVLKAVKNINDQITPALINFKITEIQKIDELIIELDGTENKSKLGANAILAVSLASARAASVNENLELFQFLRQAYNLPENNNLPTPLFNIFNGGKHADTNLDFQEFMVVPLTKISFSEKVRMGSDIFHLLGEILMKNNLDTDVGNEGGYAPDISSSIAALEYIMLAGERAGYKPGKDFGLGMDVGSSGLYNPRTKTYIFQLDNAVFKSYELLGLYEEWLSRFPFVLIEDGLAEDDWDGWKKWTREMGSKILLVGDDLFTTNINRLRFGIDEGVANSIIIKPNQIGTLSETIACARLAQRHDYKIVVSHRSGETCDDFIADLSVALGAEYIKSGSLSRSERLAKYNRLMEIEEIMK